MMTTNKKEKDGVTLQNRRDEIEAVIHVAIEVVSVLKMDMDVATDLAMEKISDILEKYDEGNIN